MRQAPFFGWIHDLSAPDPTSIINLFGLLPFDPHLVLPSFLLFLSIGIWPIMMGMTQWLQTKLNPPRRRSGQPAHVHLHAADLHLHAGRLAVGPRDLLDVEQSAHRRRSNMR